MKIAPKMLAFGTVLVSLTFAVGACSNLVEKAIEKETGAKVKTDKDGNVKIKTKDGEAEFGEGASLPKTFPKSIPLPKSGAMISATTTAEGWMLQYRGMSAKDFTDVAAQIESEGGTSTYESEMEGMRSASYELGEFSIQLMLITDADDANESMLSYVVSKTNQ